MDISVIGLLELSQQIFKKLHRCTYVKKHKTEQKREEGKHTRNKSRIRIIVVNVDRKKGIRVYRKRTADGIERVGLVFFINTGLFQPWKEGSRII